MSKKSALAALVLVVLGGLLFLLLTAPERINSGQVASLSNGDAAAGERIFHAGGCASCHAIPKSEGDKRFELPGGVELHSPFGTFVAPNISQHPVDGIGSWSLEDFANAMLKGVSPEGTHYYPAFPFSSYARMNIGDVSNLYAFMKTLPAIEGRAPGNKLSFPFNIRRGLGLWKLLFLDGHPVVSVDTANEQLGRGRYLVEGPGHCGECHTPRDVAGGLKLDQWMAGAVAAEGDGKVPNITPSEEGIGSWSAADIAYFLETGFTPDFDTAGGSMVDVIRNMAQLPAEDREAIATYLKAIDAKPNGY